MPSRREILDQDDRFRRQLLGLPEEDPEAGLAEMVPQGVPTAPEQGFTPEPLPAPVQEQDPAADFEPEPLPVPAPAQDVAPIGEPQQGGESVDVPPDIVDAPPPPEPEPDDPLMAAVAKLIAARGQGTGGSGPAPDDRGALAGEAIYKGFLRKPLEADFFKRAQDGGKTGKGRDLDPLSLLKFMADERERKWGHNFKESGEEARQSAKAYDQILRERGLKTGENRLTQADRHFGVTQDRKARELTIKTRLTELGMEDKRAEAEAKRIEKYRDDLKDLEPIDASLRELNDLIPGGIPSDSTGITKAMNSGGGFSVLDRLKAKLPGGVGTWLDMSDNKIKIQQVYKGLVDKVRHPVTGSNYTAQEKNIIEQQFGDRILEDPRAMYLAIQYIRDTTARKLQNREASVRLGMSPVGWQTYENLGGISSRSPLYGGKAEVEVADPTKSPLRNATSGDVPAASGATRDAKGDLRSAPAAPGDRGVKVNVPVSEPDGTTVDPYAATAKPAGDGYRRVYEPSAKRTAVIDAEGNLVDYEDGDTRKTGGR